MLFCRSTDLLAVRLLKMRNSLYLIDLNKLFFMVINSELHFELDEFLPQFHFPLDTGKAPCTIDEKVSGGIGRLAREESVPVEQQR